MLFAQNFIILLANYRIMKCFIIMLFATAISWGQSFFPLKYNKTYPLVTSGVLEAVAYNNTRMQILDPQAIESCIGMPKAYGILGLFDQNISYFKSNGQLIQDLSGISIEEQKLNPLSQTTAFAIAYNHLMQANNAQNSEDENAIYAVLKELSEIPDSGLINQFAKDAQVYQIIKFLNDPKKAQEFNFQVHNLNLEKFFGADNLSILSAPKTIISGGKVFDENGKSYQNLLVKSAQYGPAIWNPAASCNYSSRNGTAISAITIHTVQGTYAGCISWFQNCSASVSAHYVIRSSDGQVTQMVDEANKAWHVGSENPYTIGYEHEGYVNNASWYSDAMYNSSADLSRDIINSGYGIPALRTYYGASSASTQILGGCTKIKGHQHYSNQTHTDPGINWNWEKYYRLINNTPSITNISNANGTFTDPGGSGGNYSDDEREIWIFEPVDATSVTLDFTSFNIEANWDYLFIYDGNWIDSPLIGVYTGTNSPGTITSSGGAITVEFRSDCATTSPGWVCSYSSEIVPTDNILPITSVEAVPNWVTDDFTVSIEDTDVSGVVGKYVLLSDKDPVTSIWSSNHNLGFAEEIFESSIDNWTIQTGPFNLLNGGIECTDSQEGNSNAYLNLIQNNSTSYLYEWDQSFTSNGPNQRGGIHFFCDDPTLTNRGNSYFVFLRETDNQVQIFKSVNDTFNIMVTEPLDIEPSIVYACKVTYEPTSGWIKFYVDDQLVAQWQDIEPLQEGNSISLRTVESTINYDNIRVYKSRGNIVNIQVDSSGHFRFQSEGGVQTGRVRSMVVDLYNNWSIADSKEYLIDWTEPELIFLNDGPDLDIDSTYSTVIEANWLSEDLHSDVLNYALAIGTLPSLTNILDWTNLTTTNFSHQLSNPILGTTYHFSIKSINGAGLESLAVSNGQRLVDPSAGIFDLFKDIKIQSNPFLSEVFITGLLGENEILIYDNKGSLLINQHKFGNVVINMKQFSSGTYQLILRNGNQMRFEKLVKM